jgi:hypothetical protein
MNDVTRMTRLTDIWKTISINKKQDKVPESGEVALAALKNKIHVLCYENLTQQQKEAARKLPKGIYLDNIMSKMRLLWSTTTINHIVGT